MRRVIGLAAAAVAALWAHALNAAETGMKSRDVEASKVFAYLDTYLDLPPEQRSGVVLSYRFQTTGTQVAPRLFLLRGAEQIVLPVAADGRVELLPSLADLKARVHVLMQAPEGAKVSESLDLMSAQPLRADYAATDFNVGLEQVNRAVKKIAGPLSLMAPKMTKVVFVGAGSGELIDAAGHAQPLPMSADGPAFSPMSTPSARAIRLARAPVRIAFAAAKD